MQQALWSQEFHRWGQQLHATHRDSHESRFAVQQTHTVRVQDAVEALLQKFGVLANTACHVLANACASYLNLYVRCNDQSTLTTNHTCRCFTRFSASAAGVMHPAARAWWLMWAGITAGLRCCQQHWDAGVLLLHSSTVVGNAVHQY